MLAALLPAASLTAPEAMMTAAPSALPLSLVNSWGFVSGEAKPAPLSAARNVLVTALVYQPLLPFGTAVGPRLMMVGAPVSTIEYVAEALAERPPPSVYEQLAVWLPRS